MDFIYDEFGNRRKKNGKSCQLNNKTFVPNQKNNLLSINPELLALSFQYLSFKQLCQTVPTSANWVDE